MILAHCKNTLLDLDWAKKGEEDITLIQTCQIKPIIDLNQETIIDKKQFTIKTGSGIARPVGISPDAPTGRLEVLEKWENPYWKSEHRFYYPSMKNPIGQYIIILGNYKTGKKFVKESINGWVTDLMEKDLGKAQYQIAAA